MTEVADGVDGVQTQVAGLFGRDGLYMAMWGVQLVAAALFTPVNTRLLGANGYGRVAVAISVMMIVFSFASLSIASSVQKVFADDDGPAKARRLITASVPIAIVVTAAADFSGPIWSSTLGFGGYGGAIHYGVVMAGISSVTSVCLGYLRSQDRLVAFSGVSLLQTVAAEALSVGLVLSVSHRTAGVYMMGQLVAQVVATVAGLVLVRPLMVQRRDGLLLKQALTYCLPLVPGGLASFILTAGDRFIVQRQLGSVAVGRYQVAYNLGGLAIILLGVLNIVWMPRLFAIKDRATQSSVLVEARDNVYRLLLPVLFGLSIAGPVLLRLWVPASYHPARLGLVLVIVDVSALPFAGYLAHTRVLMVTGDTLDMAWTMVVAAVLNIVLNILLVPPMGITGSALATFLSYFALSALVRARADRIMKLSRVGPRLILQTLGGLGVALLVTRAPTTRDWLGPRFAVGALCGIWFVLLLRQVITGKRMIPRSAARVGTDTRMPQPAPARGRQLRRLTALRAFAALLVFGFHLGAHGLWNGPSRLLSVGYTGVSFFFVLSGFVLVWSAKPDTTPGQFYKHRLARIYPSFFVVLVASALVPVTAYPRTVGAALANLPLVQAWFPQTNIAFGMNGVAWSLSCELAFYLALPFALPALRRAKRRVRWAVVLAYLGVSAVLVSLGADAGGLWANAAFTDPAVRGGEFLLGVVACLEVQDGWRLTRRTSGVVLAVVAVALIAMPDTKPAPDLSLVGIFFLIVVGGAQRDLTVSEGWLTRRWLVYAGEVSFCFYLVHELVIINLGRYFGTGPAVSGLSLIVAFGAAVAVHHVVEVPMQRWINSRRWRRYQPRHGNRPRSLSRLVRRMPRLEEL